MPNFSFQFFYKPSTLTGISAKKRFKCAVLHVFGGSGEALLTVFAGLNKGVEVRDYLLIRKHSLLMSDHCIVHFIEFFDDKLRKY